LSPLINTLSDHHISDVRLLTHPLTTSTVGLGSWIEMVDGLIAET